MTDRQPSRPPPASRAGMFTGLRRTLEILAVLVAVLYFAVAGIMVGLRYVILPRIDDYRPRIEQIASRALGVSVGIQHISAAWHSFHPYLTLQGVTLTEPGASAPGLSLGRAEAVFSWSSLTHFDVRFASLTLDSPDVAVERRANGQWVAAGIPLANQATGGHTPALDWLLRQSTVVLRNGTLHWRDAKSGQPELNFTNVRFLLQNSANRHRAGLQAAPPAAFAGPLDVRADFRHAFFAPVSDTSHWRGKVYADLGSADLARLAAYYILPALPADPGIRGQAAARAWVDFAGGHVTAGTAQVAMRGLQTRLRDGLAPLDIEAASFRINGQAMDDGASWQARDIQLTLPGRKPLNSGTLNGRYLPANAKHGEQAALSGDALDIGLLVSLAPSLPLPDDLRTPLETWQPRGMLRDYDVALQRPRPVASSSQPGWRSLPGLKYVAPERLTYTLRARFEGLGMNSRAASPATTPQGHPRLGMPGFDGLTGAVHADQDGGSLTLDAQNSAVEFPGLFDAPRVAFDHIDGDARWSVSHSLTDPGAAPRVKVNITRLHLANADLDGRVSGTYMTGGKGSGLVDLNGDIERADAAAIPRYLPTGIGPHVRAYLQHALLGGSARNATFQIKGDLDDFPYDKHPGTFHVNVPVTGVRFDPVPRAGSATAWPPFEQVRGTLHFDRGNLQFALDSARVYGITLKQINGDIGDMGHPQSKLEISGNAAGPMQDFVRYINTSPIAQWIGDFTSDTRASGNGQLALKLDMPLEHVAETRVAGRLDFQRNDVVLIKGLPTLGGVDGKLNFTERGLALDGLRGRFLGSDIRAEGGNRPDGSIQIRAAGTVNAQALRGNTDDPLLARLGPYISGSTSYAATITARHGPPEITVQSNLAGLALNLPAPLTKTAETSLPARFSIRPLPAGTGPAGGDAEAIDLGVGSVQASYVWRNGPNGAAPTLRGGIGINQPVPQPNSGVLANVALDMLDLDAWRAIIAQLGSHSDSHDGAAASTASQPSRADSLSAYLPTRIALRAKEVRLISRPWPNVVIGAQRNADEWQFNIASDQISGSGRWRWASSDNPFGELRARLAKLVIPKEEQGGDVLTQVLEEPTEEFPAIDLSVNEFVLRGLSLGKLDVAAHNIEEDHVPVWQLTRLDLTNPAAHLAATGNWRTSRRRQAATPGGEPPRRTVLDFKLDIKDGGALLERLGLTKTLKNGQGTISGKIGWAGGPSAIDYPTLTGRVALELKQGQILKADTGLAKLLGILSVQSLAKILMLDFNSVLGQGLPFDHITANGTVRNGIASTEDFTLASNTATIEMHGTTNIDKETQDLHVTILPRLNAASASLAYAFVNPALGLGTFFAQLALGDQLSKTLASQYTITGSWSEPVIRHVGDNQGKMEAVPSLGS